MTTDTAGSAAPPKGLHLGAWAAQALLALAFLTAGAMKLAAPLDELAKNMAWIPHVPGWLVRFIGASEVLGALGLILPAATRIKPVLTPIAAALLVVVMVLGAATHVAIGEAERIVVNAVMGGLAAFVAWARFKPAAIAGK
ncbi:MAG: DoxX family protein [Myxococcaceae bacterium]|nr:DoxX family protein [Myxococcaceae bacterium]